MQKTSTRTLLKYPVILVHMRDQALTFLEVCFQYIQSPPVSLRVPQAKPLVPYVVSCSQPYPPPARPPRTGEPLPETLM